MPTRASLPSRNRLYLGTSGWSYPQWKTEFYGNIPSAGWLKEYARHFSSVELNSSFYRLPSEAAIAKWVADTPPDFRFAVKAWRRITHDLGLRDAEEDTLFYLRRMANLGDRLGAVLFQLPPSLQYDSERLHGMLRILPKSLPIAFEFRHPSWECAATERLLADRNIAWCASLGGANLPNAPRTADWAYLRFHGPERYKGNYRADYLQQVADWIGAQKAKSVYAYFNNTIGSIFALENARSLELMLGGWRKDSFVKFFAPEATHKKARKARISDADGQTKLL